MKYEWGSREWADAWLRVMGMLLGAAFYFANVVGAVVVIGEAIGWWDRL